MARDERLERVAAGPQRDEYLPPLLLADDPEAQGAPQLGDLYVLRGGGRIALRDRVWMDQELAAR